MATHDSNFVIEHDISIAFRCSSLTMVSICFARYKKHSGYEELVHFEPHSCCWILLLPDEEQQ